MDPRRSRRLFLGLLCIAGAARAERAAAQVWDPAECAACAQAESLLAVGDTAAALVLLRNAVAGTDDARAGGELGLLLARRLTGLWTDSIGRGEARALLERALRVEPWRPRWALGYGLILWKQGRDDEALDWTDAALRAADALNGGLEPPLLAELHAARGLMLEERVLDREGLAKEAALITGSRVTSQGAVAVLDLSLERLLQAPLEDPESEDVRQAMRRHLTTAFVLDPLFPPSTYALLAEAARAREWDAFVALAREYVAASGGGGWPLAFLGAGLWRSGDGPGAEATFEAALKAIDEAGREILEDVSQSVTPENEDRYLGGTRASRAAWRRFLLRTADPLFLTPINERKLEHFTRVALAELLFGEPVNRFHGTQFGQGQILVRYGEPDVERRVPPPGAPGPSSKPRIFWAYDDERANFLFNRPAGRRGGFHTFASGDYADRLRKVQPSTYDFRVEPMRHQLVRFQGDTPELVEVDVHALLPPGPPDGGLSGRAGLFFLPRTLEEELVRIETAVRIGGDGPGLVTFRAPMAPSSYTYTVEAMTEDESIRARTLGTLLTAPFVDRQPGLSDILLADDIAERYGVPARGRRDLTIVPSADLCFDADASVWVYFEIYLLSPDAGGAGRYRVALDVEDTGGRSVIARVSDWVAGALGRDRERGKERVVWERTVAPLSPRTPEWFEVRLEAGGTGMRRISITVTDLVSGGTMNTQRAFMIDGDSDCEILPGTP